MRKDFTVSERVAIADAVAKTLEGRVGNPDFKANSGNFSPIEESGRSRDIAASKSGLGSGKTYEAAKKVVEEAEPEVVAAMDSGSISISQAAKLSEAAPEVQRAVAIWEKSIRTQFVPRAIKSTKANYRKLA